MITCPFTTTAWRAGGVGGGVEGRLAGGGGGQGLRWTSQWPELALVMTAHAPHFWSFLQLQGASWFYDSFNIWVVALGASVPDSLMPCCGGGSLA